MISGITNLGQSSVLTQMQNKFQDRIQYFDNDGNGTITKSEFNDSISKSGPNDKAQKLFEVADSNGDGEVTVDEQNALFDKVKQRALEGISSAMGGLPVGELMQTSGGGNLSSLSFTEPQNVTLTQLIEAWSQESPGEANLSTRSSLVTKYAVDAYSRNAD